MIWIGMMALNILEPQDCARDSSDRIQVQPETWFGSCAEEFRLDS